jgi:hypothetical protein
MSYITSLERIGYEKGCIEGQAEGRVEGKSRLLCMQLERRYGALPAPALEHVRCASEEDLDTWGDAALTAPTLEAVFQHVVIFVCKYT